MIKKFLVGGMVAILAVSLAGCEKKSDYESVTWNLTPEQTTEGISGFGPYTNPLFRYELRVPKGWTYQDDATDIEGGRRVVFYPENKKLSDDYKGAVIVKGFVNWNVGYSIGDYFRKEVEQDLWVENIQKETVTFDGSEGTLLRSVTGLPEADKMDVIGFELNDRIVEIRLIDQSEDAKLLLNSINFYGDKVITPEE